MLRTRGIRARLCETVTPRALIIADLGNEDPYAEGTYQIQARIRPGLFGLYSIRPRWRLRRGLVP